MTSLPLLHAGPANNRIGIVFIHGIDGDHPGTWTNIEKSQCWIDWIKDIPASIYAFSHEASKTDIQNIFSLDEIASHLKEHIDQHEEIAAWIFVCHSLGGLIAKRAYVEISRKKKTASHFVFFGTPHRGARFYCISNFVRSWLHRDHIVRTLTANEPYLNSLNQDFLEFAARNKSEILSFYENRRLFGFHVVSKAETVIGAPYKETVPLYGDHSQICKFSSAEDTGFLITRSFITKIIEKNRAFRIRPYTSPKF